MSATKKRYTESIRVPLKPEELKNIETIAAITGMNKCEVVRKGLHNLSAHYELPTPWSVQG